MSTKEKTAITVKATIQASSNKVWKFLTEPQHIVNWNTAIPEWHCPRATNDLRVGGRFSYRMEARDGSFGFDFAGSYDFVKPGQQIAYTLDDDRKVKIDLSDNGNHTEITETFEAEGMNPIEMQKDGWQAILNNFKKYVESHSKTNLK